MIDVTPRENHLLCIGYGYSASHVARLLHKKDWQISGTWRTSEKKTALQDQRLTPISYETPDEDHLRSVTHLLISTPPQGATCPGLNFAHKAITCLPNLKGVIYYSTTGVYGDHAGNWVDEETPTVPVQQRSVNRLLAEDAWRAFGREHRLPVITLRLSGIYGPGRNALEKLKRDPTASNIDKPGHVFCRIHVADIARITAEILTRLTSDNLPAHDLYNLADDLPAPSHEVTAFAADLLGIAPPPLVPIEDAELSPMAQSFYDESRRVKNQRLKQDLGLTLQYPTYREGLTALF